MDILHIIFCWHRPDWRIGKADGYGNHFIYCRKCECMKEQGGYNCHHRPGECGDGDRA